MSDKNFSWGILGSIMIGVLAILTVGVLAVTGYFDNVVVGLLIGVAQAVVTGLVAIMNPNRKFSDSSIDQEQIRQIGESFQKINKQVKEQHPNSLQ